MAAGDGMPGFSPIAPEMITRALAACIAAFPVAGEAPAPRVLAHAAHESGLQQYAVGVNRDGRRGLPAESRAFRTEAEAVAFARAKLADGRRVDAGVMQITDANWPAYGLTLATVFRVEPNVCAGARILGEAYRTERRAACRYNTGRPDCGNGYPEAVDRAAARLAAPGAPRPAAAPAPAAPPPPLPETGRGRAARDAVFAP
ncbi:lysozyme family protein [Craurococcus roseus]